MIDNFEISPFNIGPIDANCIKAKRIVPLFDGKVLQMRGKSWQDWYDEYWQTHTKSGCSFYIGHIEGVAIDAYQVDHIANFHLFELLPLRQALMAANAVDAAILNRASQIIHWFNNHPFCSSCGAHMQRDQVELMMRCTQCDAVSYPQISPCVIVLIHRDNKILLAHHVRYATKKIYSTIAGFIEAGESAESAVHREVLEETGIKVKKLRYFGSQAWPFPHQLMLAFFAEYDSGEINIDQMELLDAKWWDINALPAYPPNGSIAGQLIEHYVMQARQS